MCVPTPIGPGEYETEDGEKAIILGNDPECMLFPWIGYVVGRSPQTFRWSNFGNSSNSLDYHKLKRKWVEPVHTKDVRNNLLYNAGRTPRGDG